MKMVDFLADMYMVFYPFGLFVILMMLGVFKVPISQITKNRIAVVFIGFYVGWGILLIHYRG